MGTAIVSAIFGTPASPSDVIVDCQTGNCTFQAYSTMGICSRVDNVTPTIVRKCPRRNDGTSRGCNYTVQELQDHPPWRLETLTTLFKERPIHSLWIGASDIGNDYRYPNLNTLVEFYAIYVSDTDAFSSDFDGNFSDSVVALKGSLDLCVLSYHTRFVNGITQTVELGRKDALAWQTESKKVCANDTSFCDVVTSSTGGDEYWMSSTDKEAFNQYLGLEIFRGYSSAGLRLETSDETGLIDTAPIIAGLLVNQPKSNGQDAMTKMLDNLAVGMTNS